MNKLQERPERETMAALYKEHRRRVNVANGIDTAFVIASFGMGNADVGLSSTIIMTPLVALGCGIKRIK